MGDLYFLQRETYCKENAIFLQIMNMEIATNLKHILGLHTVDQ